MMQTITMFKIFSYHPNASKRAAMATSTIGGPKENKYVLPVELAGYYARGSTVACYQHKAGRKDPFYASQLEALLGREGLPGATGLALKFEKVSQRYSFASFLEVMLLENFDPDYLSATAGRIEERSLAYRMLYTKAYDALESQADSSVRAVALGDLSGAMGFLAKTIEKTPVGDLTPLDEVLQDASKDIGDFSKGVKRDMMRKIADARSSDVRPFVENIENVNRLYNEPTMLLADEDVIYVLPVEKEKQDEADSE